MVLAKLFPGCSHSVGDPADLVDQLLLFVHVSCSFHSTRGCVSQRTWTRLAPPNSEAADEYGHVFDVQSSFREAGGAMESSKAWSCNAPHCPRIIAMEVPSERRSVILRLWVVTPTKSYRFAYFGASIV